LSPAPAPIPRPLVAHWRKTRRALVKLAELYETDPETPAIAFPLDQIRELIEVFDGLVENTEGGDR